MLIQKIFKLRILVLLMHQMSAKAIPLYAQICKYHSPLLFVWHCSAELINSESGNQKYIYMLPLATNEGPDTLHDWCRNYISFILLGFYFLL